MSCHIYRSAAPHSLIDRYSSPTHCAPPPGQTHLRLAPFTPPTKSDNEALSCVSHQPFIFLKNHSLNSLVNRLIVAPFELRITWQCFGLLHPPTVTGFSMEISQKPPKEQRVGEVNFRFNPRQVFFNQILSLIDLDKNVTTQNIKGS